MQRPLRLRQSADYARLREAGRTLRHPLCMLSIAPNTLSHNRYGFVVSKRIGNAVQRNRVRRRLREIVRLLHPKLQGGYDLAWIVRNGITAQPYSNLNEITIELLRRAKLFKAEE